MGLISDDSRERIPELTVGDRVPLHPALTDVPVATLSLAPVFDAIALVTGSRDAGAAGLWSAATGVLWAAPTAAAGTLDYLHARSRSPVKRIGLAHAALNTFALTMMSAALISRRFRSAPTPLSLLFSAAAGAAITYSSHLGGVMVYREGMRVSGEGLQAANGAHEATTGRDAVQIDEWAAIAPAPSTAVRPARAARRRRARRLHHRRGGRGLTRHAATADCWPRPRATSSGTSSTGWKRRWRRGRTTRTTSGSKRRAAARPQPPDSSGYSLVGCGAAPSGPVPGTPVEGTPRANVATRADRGRGIEPQPLPSSEPEGFAGVKRSLRTQAGARRRPVQRSRSSRRGRYR